MKLVSVYEAPFAVETLYQLLRSRLPNYNISHKKMPAYEEHERFVRSHPYRKWMLIELADIHIGAIYLTDRDEIGIHLFPQYHGHDYEAHAITTIMALYCPHHAIVNINPANTEYKHLLENLGFKLIQHTYEKII